MITVKCDDGFIGEIDSIVGSEGYQDRTDFITNALREKVEESKLRQAMSSIAHLKGSSKKQTSNKIYEETRKMAFDEIASNSK